MTDPAGARLDPDYSGEVFGAFHAAVAVAVDQFGGDVANHMGDGVTARSASCSCAWG